MHTTRTVADDAARVLHALRAEHTLEASELCAAMLAERMNPEALAALVRQGLVAIADRRFHLTELGRAIVGRVPWPQSHAH